MSTPPAEGRTPGVRFAGDRILARAAAPLRHELVDQIRAAILAFDYEPGERLVERTLCEMYGVSRTVVREALRQLETEGLVTLVPNRGPVVAKLTTEDAIAVFEVRAELEGLAARLFASKASPEERKELEEQLEHVQGAFESGDLEASLAAKDAFYAALFAGAHNGVMRSTILGLHARIRLLRGLSLQVPGRHRESYAEIREIADAAIAGDSRNAADAARRHVERSGAVALRQLAAGKSWPSSDTDVPASDAPSR